MTPRPTPQAGPLLRPTVSTSSHSDGYDPSPGLGAASRFLLHSLHRFSLLLAFICDREDQSTVPSDPEQTLTSVQPLKSCLLSCSPGKLEGGLVPLPPPRRRVLLHCSQPLTRVPRQTVRLCRSPAAVPPASSWSPARGLAQGERSTHVNE